MLHRSAAFRASYIQARWLAKRMAHGAILSELAICYEDAGSEGDPRQADLIFGRIDGLTDGLIADMPPGTAEPMFSISNQDPAP
jgi:hypothetical protein